MEKILFCPHHVYYLSGQYLLNLEHKAQQHSWNRVYYHHHLSWGATKNIKYFSNNIFFGGGGDFLALIGGLNGVSELKTATERNIEFNLYYPSMALPHTFLSLPWNTNTFFNLKKM